MLETVNTINLTRDKLILHYRVRLDEGEYQY